MMNIADMGQKLVRASLILFFGAALAACNAPGDAPAAKPPLEGARIGASGLASRIANICPVRSSRLA